MSYKLKKNYSANEKPMSHHDRDSYITERSSIPSLDEPSPLPRVNHHQKEPNKLVYSYNQLPENGIPLAVQAKQTQKEQEKMRKELYRKAPPGQGSLAPIPEPKQTDMETNYYPYWYYYKAKNPDWVMRHRQLPNGQMVPYESFDPSQYAHPPAVTTPTKKSRRRHKKNPNDSFVLQYNSEKKCYEWVQKDAKRPVPEHYTSLNDIHSNQANGKPQTENEWHEHYLQSLTNNNRLSANDPRTSKHHHHHRHHHHHHSKKTRQDENDKRSPQSADPPPNHQHRHHHHHHHHHHHEFHSQEFQVRDHSFKKSERAPFFQPAPDSFPSSPPAIYNQSSLLPPLPHERPYVLNYSSTQTFKRDWETPSISPRVHRRDSQSNFYDRYLNNVITKKVIE